MTMNAPTPTIHEVLPCPFCGGKPRIDLAKKEHCQLHGEPSQRVAVYCDHRCAARPRVEAGDVYNDGEIAARQKAVAAWNRRAALESITADGVTVEALGEAVAFLLERLEPFADGLSDASDVTQYHGHVAPAVARLRSCLSTPSDTAEAMGVPVADERLRLNLGNLLAIIHRDGGHYELEHGTAKAVEEAHRIIGELLDTANAETGPVGEAVAADCDLIAGALVIPIKDILSVDQADALFNDIRRALNEAARPATETQDEVKRLMRASLALINDTAIAKDAHETAEAALAATRERLEKEREIERRHWQAKVDALNAECEATLLRAETAESTLSETRTALRQSQRALMSLPGPQSLEVADCIATNRAALTGDAQEGGK